jgi:heme-degrading monooxygenase HmoA
MIVVLFENKLSPDVDPGEYEEAFARMYGLVSQMPGFISIDGYTKEDGSELAVVRFESESALGEWKNNPDHLLVQARGREAFYDSYKITVATQIREYGFAREARSDAQAH